MLREDVSRFNAGVLDGVFRESDADRPAARNYRPGDIVRKLVEFDDDLALEAVEPNADLVADL